MLTLCNTSPQRQRNTKLNAADLFILTGVRTINANLSRENLKACFAAAACFSCGGYGNVEAYVLNLPIDVACAAFFK